MSLTTSTMQQRKPLRPSPSLDNFSFTSAIKPTSALSPNKLTTTRVAAGAAPQHTEMGSTSSQRRPLLPTTSIASPPSYSSVVDSSLESGEPESTDTNTPKSGTMNMHLGRLSGRSRWIALAVASGGCAAFNGVFAKLTTTDLTTHIAISIANLLGLGNGEKVVEYIIRAMFFALNLIFNGIMWALFTKALTSGTSTTQVSIINTSANFMTTAILSFFIFTESLPPLWWLGAALLVAGNVIIGRREEKDTGVLGPEGEIERGEEGEGLLEMVGGEDIDLDEGGLKGGEDGGREEVGGGSDDDDVLDLGLERVKSEDETLLR